MRDSIFEVETSGRDVTSLLQEKSNASDKVILMENGTTIRSKVSNEERFAFLALEKAEDQKSDEFQDKEASLDRYN